MADLFVYGTLRHLPLMRAVLGHAPPTPVDAELPRYRVAAVEGEDYPALLPAEKGRARGLLFRDLSGDDLRRLDFYECEPGFDYKRVTVEVEVDGQVRPACTYLPSNPPAGLGDWSFPDWARRFGDLAVLAAQELMDTIDDSPPGAAARRFPTMRMRAASFLRAQASDTPTRLRSATPRDAVQVLAARRPYVNYFAVAEDDLRHPRFDGSMSAEVTRAAFVSGDAVTILPYDPQRDRVLMIEQFRFGVFVRGDRHPWVLEPVAGRIDPGETAEEAGLRELREEAGITARRLLPIASYYPSPGALSEYLYSFVGLCDLPDRAAGIGGLASEDEDIRSHIVPFRRALAMIEDGEADCAPLVLSLLWLSRHRARLRKDG